MDWVLKSVMAIGFSFRSDFYNYSGCKSSGFRKEAVAGA
jgi:hypothetical protein